MSEAEKKVRKKKKSPAKKLFVIVGEKPAQIKDEWFARIANEYGFTKFEHVPKCGAFRCYIGDRHVEWSDYRELAKENEEYKFRLPCKISRRYTKTGKRLFKSMQR